MNLLRELACADFLNTNYYDKAFEDYELFNMVTRNAAVIAGLKGVIGSLAGRFLVYNK